MASPRGDPTAHPSLVRVEHPVTVDMVAMQDYQRLPNLVDLPEASIQRSARMSLGQSRIPRLTRRGNVQRAETIDMGVIVEDFTDSRYRPLASSQDTVAHPRVTAGPTTPTPADRTALPDPINNPPTPGGVWATNASNFASGSDPKFRFVNDMRSSEPRLNRDKGKGTDKRYNTEPVANGRECHCFECDALKKGLLSSEMIYAYLAMRGVQGGEGLFEELMVKHRENGRGRVVPSCPHAREKMSKEQEASASKREGRRPAVNVPSFACANAGLSEAGPSAAGGPANAGPSAGGRVNAGPSGPVFNDFRPSVAGPGPSVAATLNTTPSLAGLGNISYPNSVPSFSTDFNFDDAWDDGNVAKDVITPGGFLRMASGVSRVETDKPLPPLPLNPGETSSTQLENESGNESDTVVGSDSGNENSAAIDNDSGNEVENVSALGHESEDGTELRDRVAEQDVRAQVCEETMEALTGSYAVSSNPSVLNDPPGVHHLDRLRGAFGTLFSRMQPRFGERLDRIRLGLRQENESSMSVLSDNQYTDNELEAALASPSATPINGISPDQVQISLAEAEHAVGHIEGLETAAHRRAVGASQHLDFLRNTLGRITAGAQYIAQHRSSLRHAKIRRSVGQRLRGLEYRRARALDNLMVEETRHARDSEAIRVVEEAIARVLETVDLATVEEVLSEASRLWLQDHGQGESG